VQHERLYCARGFLGLFKFAPDGAADGLFKIGHSNPRSANDSTPEPATMKFNSSQLAGTAGTVTDAHQPHG